MLQNPSVSAQYRDSDPDQALIQAMARGDIQALDELYARHAPMLIGFLSARLNNRQIAEEILQDVMLAAWENAAAFEGRSKVKTWLLTIARNRAINAYRKRRVPQMQLDDAFELQSEDTGPMEATLRADQQEAVRAAIQELPDEQREVLILVFYHQLSGPEVAEVLGISQGTVKSRLHRAKTALKRILSQWDRL